MELRHLRYFVAVAEARHMTRAAERLGMQQPPLSQQIKALEAELGCELFRRHPKGVELTAGGKAYLPEARAILASVEMAAAKAARAAEGLHGSISIGVTSSAATHSLIPQIIRAYRAAYPDVNIDLSDGNAAELTEEVEDGRLHAAFLRAPVANPPKLVFHHLLDEEMLLILPMGHALLGAKSGAAIPRIPLKSIAGEPLVLVRRPGAPGLYADLLVACKNAGFVPKIAAEVQHMLLNISFVAAGMGVSVVPASLRGILHDKVVYCRVLGARPSLVAPITLVCRANEESPAASNFIRLAIQPGQARRPR
ncbi:MAG: LysR family transcriptional regulator [Bryobacteraceae bacterium]